MLTQVPVESLKSSLTRPSKTNPLIDVVRIDLPHGIADPVETFRVERSFGEFAGSRQ